MKQGIIVWLVAVLLVSCGPLYVPGSLARALEKEPPAAGGADPWEVEPGIRLHHFSQGKGRVVLVIHGGPGMPMASAWPSLEPLADRYQFVYYHQRGSGLSTRPIDRLDPSDFYQSMVRLDATLGLGTQLADIERIRRLLGEDKLLLLGHSYGGFLAALYAREFPGRVEKLILAAPAQVLSLPPPQGGGLFGAIEAGLGPSSLSHYRPWLKQYMDFGALFQNGEQDLVTRNNALVPFWNEAAARLNPGWGGSEAVHPELTGGWVQYAMMLSLGASYDLRAEVSQVKVPVLIVAGDRDLAAPQEALIDWQRTLPQALVVKLAGGGHFLSQSPTLAKALEPFLTP